MSIFESLYQKHASHAWNNRKRKLNGDHSIDIEAYMRAEQLLRLDIALEKHRSIYATQWEPLAGITALNHLLFVRTGWTPQQIEALSFGDILLLLLKDLGDVSIPKGTTQLPARLEKENEALKRAGHQILLPPCSPEEWDHSLYEKLKDEHKNSSC